MKVNELSRSRYFELLREDRDELLRRILAPEVFIVKEFYRSGDVLSFRDAIFASGKETEPSWHPLHDGCPDYHRLHDDYEKAYVKGKIHTYYHHGWYEKNRALFDRFKEVFEMKILLAGKGSIEMLRQIPSQGLVARVNVHHYPKGGGYQAEHVDPHGEFAKIQTIVQASQPGKDFNTGGLYARETPDSQPFFIDRFTAPGDLIVLSPAIRHGVAPIDEPIDEPIDGPNEGKSKLDWRLIGGRWIIMPLFVWSDYPHPDNVKPSEVK